MRWGCGRRGWYPGVETPITPDEPDVLDAGGGVEGLGCLAGDGFVECAGLHVGLRDLLPADEQMENKGNDIFHAAAG